MAFTTFIVYFKPDDANANRDIHRGLWITAVASKSDGDDYVAVDNNESAVTSVYGTGTLGVSAAAVEIPPLAQPYLAYYHDEGDASGTLQQVPRYSGYSTAIQQLRTALTIWHNRLHDLYTLLNQIGPNYPQTDVSLGHSILYRLHQGTYLVARNTDITLANRLAWLAASALGPNEPSGSQQYDPNDPETFFDIASAITSSTLRDSTHPLEVAASETRTVSRTDFTLGDRLSIAQMLDSNHAPDGDVPSVSDLKRGGWIDEVTA